MTNIITQSSCQSLQSHQFGNATLWFAFFFSQISSHANPSFTKQLWKKKKEKKFRILTRETVSHGSDDEEAEEDRRGEANRVHVRRRRGADRHVADVPERVRRVQNRHQVAPAARAEGVEGGARGGLSRQRCPR